MSKTFLTIAEPTIERTLEALADAPAGIDGIEIRFDRLPMATTGLLAEVRSATKKPLLFTRRQTAGGADINISELTSAIAAGFELVDLELAERIPAELEPHRNRVVLSHHDFESVPPIAPLLTLMQGMGTGHVKIAVTPRSFVENLALLKTVDAIPQKNVTVTGMGDYGIYSRMLAPMYGSELTFVARNAGSRAAPGQLTLDEFRAVHPGKPARRPSRIFALVGNPASHSRSPAIHNPIFRNSGVDAVYVLIQNAEFHEVGEALASGRRYAPAGLGVTAPFKQDAFRFVLERGGTMTPRARISGAVNTVIRHEDGSIEADNTDIDGFLAAIERLKIDPRESAAVIGAGGTARAALYALSQSGIRSTIFNRTYERALALGSAFGVSASRLDDLERFEGRVIVNTAGGALDLPDGVLRRGRALINAGYSEAQARMDDLARAAGMDVFTGIELLEAQAPAQSKMFLEGAGPRTSGDGSGA